MAEAVVSFVIEKLGDLLIQEAISLYQVRDQVDSIEREFKRMQCFLKDADTKQKGDERVRNWVGDVRDVAYEAEDVIDTFILRLTHHRRRTGFIGSVRRYFFFFKELIMRHKVAEEIEGIKNKISDISESRRTYGIENIGGEGTSYVSERLRERRRSSPRLEEQDVIGLDNDIETLVARLLGQDARRCVISIVGMGGLGKTTLAKKVYNHKDVKKHFNFCAWVYVSQEYRARELLYEIGKVMGIGKEGLTRMSKEDIAAKLSKILSRKRYLIVMDDIWKIEVWDELKAVFPDGFNGSRVLFTTRIRDVALHADPGSPLHEPHFLSDKEGWELFLKKALPMENNTTTCPPELEKVGKEIVSKCGGLPLAIVILGGLLSRKEKNPSIWLKVLQSVSWQLTQDPKQLLEILALSYNDLPHYLKPCFLYFGLFPEDSEISGRKLILLWIAEGFVQQRDEESVEDVAEDYLEELVDRSMIHVTKRKSDGGIKTCRIHDLLRDLAISEAKECKFLSILDSINFSSVATTRARRLAIHSSLGIYMSMGHFNPHMRSMLRISSLEESLRRDQWKNLYQSLKLLRVLELEGAVVHILPNEIGELIHLRYLGLRKTGLQRLPSSIGNLKCLQILDTRGTSFSRIPSKIWTMPQLRHLYLNNNSITDHPPPHDFGRNLCTLLTVSIYGNSWIHHFLGRLTTLRKLGIHGYLVSQAKDISNALVKLSNLQTLQLTGCNQILEPTLTLLLSQLKVQKLYISGAIAKLPAPHDFQTNLIKLSLELSHLVEDPFVTLEQLRNLRILRLLSNSFVGKKMICSARGFPKLLSLELVNLDKLEEWRVEEGALPCLQRLTINGCEELKMIPEGLQYVNKLQELIVQSMPDEFEFRIQDQWGDDRYKIQHIPSVIIKL